MQKTLRIKRSKEIAQIVQTKNKVYCPYFTIYYKEANAKSRVAFSVSKKYGNAVERNRAKRVLRVCIKPYIVKEGIYIDLVVVAKAELKNATFQDITQKMSYCYNLIYRKIKKESK